MRSMILGLAAFAIGTIFVASAPAQHVTRVSVDTSGVEGDGKSESASISANGRYVVFLSTATNLVAGDTNGKVDVFVHDRRTGVTSRVSVDSSGVEGDGDCYDPSISGDGRYVSFASYATNLSPTDTYGANRDVFLHDRATGVTTMVSLDSSGAPHGESSYDSAISADGRFVAFFSEATNLDADHPDIGGSDVFVRDLAAGTTSLASRDSSGTGGDNPSRYPMLSADGRYVVFSSDARNLDGSDLNHCTDTFVHDLQTGTTERMSVDSAGAEGNGFSHAAGISADGRLALFYGSATNLDPSGVSGVFLHDRETGTTTIVSVDSSGDPSNGQFSFGAMNADGDVFAFVTSNYLIVRPDLNHANDVFVHEASTGSTWRASQDSTGVEGDAASSTAKYSEPFSADGRFLVFHSDATNLDPSDGNGVRDVFVSGPFLSLEIEPALASAGDTVTLAEWGGAAGAMTLLALVDLDGTPLFAPLLIDAFDAVGELVDSETVPDGLAGITLTLQGFGIVPSGRVEATNPAVIALQ